ncbi:MAG: NAD-dependent epimerase/dehydratase family protein [Anaerolineales bacterium]|nr:NAD-dependent epimerase/dehydratase family protein [Anaerolineales bacterium]HNQ93591.1 NAD-dependent epimerase/dehydratase family protein [Anaerolineales bacterium]
MKTLVTGGAGFIGSHIAEALLARGDSVRVLDNFSAGKRENIAAIAKDVEIIEGDLRDSSRVGEAVRGMDAVFHSAAFVSVPQSMDEPQECFDINVSGTHLLLESARREGVRRVALASSAAVYGESDALPLVEETPLQPKSPYALSKRINEMYAELFTDEFGLEVVALRYFNVYGPRQRPDSMYAAAVPIFIQRLLDGKPVMIFGDGGQTRDLINIHDVVRANLIAAEHPNAAGKIFNICTGIETRLLDLLEVLYEFFPNAPPTEFASPRAGDIYRSVGSPQKAKDIIGFTATTSLTKGLKETIESMRQSSALSGASRPISSL